MKVVVLFVISQIIFVTALYSQTNRNAFHLSFGPSISTGNYASTSASNSLSGYAKLGIVAHLSFSHKLDKNLALEVMLYAQQNGLHRKAMSQQLSETGFFDHPVRHYRNWIVEDKKWRVGALLAGASYELFMSHNDRITIVPRIMAGAVYAQLPSVLSNSRMDTSYAVFGKSKLKGFGAAFLAGTSINYKVTNRVGLSFNIEYFLSSKVQFKDVITEVAATNGGLIIPNLYDLSNSREHPLMFQYQTDEKQTVNSINTKLGIFYLF